MKDILKKLFDFTPEHNLLYMEMNDCMADALQDTANKYTDGDRIEVMMRALATYISYKDAENKGYDLIYRDKESGQETLMEII
jgi:hypothetical protein